MSSQKKYKIIAAFLLIVFSLNTVAGFACSVGIDMGYNTKHHEHESSQSHSHCKSHFHNAAHKHHQSSSITFNDAGNKDDCCANEVTKFIHLDKSVVNSYSVLQTPIFLLAFTSAFFVQKQGEIGNIVKSNFQFVRRSCSPDDTDIRIAIQSFQI
jgi:hypothetical protein